MHQDGWSALCVCAPCLYEMMGRTLYILGSEPAYYTLMGEGGRRGSSSPGPLSNNMGPTNGSENATRRFIWKAGNDRLCKCFPITQRKKLLTHVQNLNPLPFPPPLPSHSPLPPYFAIFSLIPACYTPVTLDCPQDFSL